jgi:FkbM family methyltransferase
MTIHPSPTAPPATGFKENLVLALMKLSFLLREHPIRFLYSDSVLRFLGSKQNSEELVFFKQRWQGPIWDVGASVGKFTAMLAEANPDRTVYAFEPNLNSLYYLGHRTSRFPNVVIVPCALTIDGKPFTTSHSADFFAQPTGPMAHSISLTEALAKFGQPAFAKFDIEGGEYSIFAEEPTSLAGSHLLIEWHKYKTEIPIPTFKNWETAQPFIDTEAYTTHYYSPKQSTSSDKA